MEMKRKIADFLSQFAGEDEVAELLALCVGRVLLKQFKVGEGQLPSHEIMHHIADWLTAAVRTDATWLSNRDQYGRPKKLMKFSTIEQIAAEADKAMLAESYRLASVQIAEGDEELHQELEDGYYLVRLLTEAALDRESAAMQHCIGNGGYDYHLHSGGRLFLSLRDKAGKPHVTMDIDVSKRALLQLQGKQNKAPAQRYAEILKPFFEQSRFSGKSLSKLGFVMDKCGKLHHFDALPERLQIEGDLDLATSGIRKLPKGLVVSGSLNASFSQLSELPEDVVVGEHINLTATPIKRLPNLRTVHGDLLLGGTKIRELPDNLFVEGSLTLGETALPELPRGLVVRGSLDISRTSIGEIPDDIKIGVQLIMYHTTIRNLPDSVDDDLVVYHGWADTVKKKPGPRLSTGCLAGDLKIKPERPSLLKRMFDFAMK